MAMFFYFLTVPQTKKYTLSFRRGHYDFEYTFVTVKIEIQNLPGFYLYFAKVRIFEHCSFLKEGLIYILIYFVSKFDESTPVLLTGVSGGLMIFRCF